MIASETPVAASVCPPLCDHLDPAKDNFFTYDEAGPTYTAVVGGLTVGLAFWSLVGPFLPAAAATAAPAIPRLTSGEGPQMYRQARELVRGMAPAQRVEVFRNFAGQIEAATRGNWFAREFAAQNGTMFTGRAGETLVFDAAGMMFKGNFGNTDQFMRSAASVVINYDKLIPLR